jgi:hypothetical protein
MAKKRTTRYVKRTITVDVYAMVEKSTSDEDALQQASEACEAVEGTHSSGRFGFGPDGLSVESVVEGVTCFFDVDSIEYCFFEGGEIITEDQLP